MISRHRPSALLAFVVALGSLAPFAAANASELVKQSNSGICHPPESRWYERTENYTAFNSVEACLEADGRLPKGLTLTSLNDQNERSTDRQEYTRSAFGHGWDDADGDCQDSRAEALIATSTTTVRFAESDRCRVVTGRWISPFTGKVIQNAGDIDIDHLLPLAWAWRHGAGQWTRAKRERFANDPVNLWPVEAGLNRRAPRARISGCRRLGSASMSPVSLGS